MNTIWFDVTTSFKWRRPAVGIIRAEKEVGKYLIKSTCTKLEFCIYDNKSNLYYKINKSIAANLLADEFSDVSENIQDVKICEANFEKNDVYMTMGLDWDHKDYEQLYRIKKTKCFKVVTFCYDLIPVIFPHYCVGDVAAMFAKYFVSLAWVSDHVLCISHSTKSDFDNLIHELGAIIPPSSIIKLGCDIKNIDTHDISPIIANLITKKYILFVSTIDRRKNHEVIYRALTRIADRRGEIPHVVFVGMQGWGVENLMKDIELDPRTREYITILNNISDNELVILYKNTQFTVYPSLYEGWGLPVAESLAYGKYCLASNTSSIPEVGGDLIEYLDPYDVNRWSHRLENLSQNTEFLKEIEKSIKNNYALTSWDETGANVFDVILRLLHSDHDCHKASPVNFE
jgi:glycosyltransferase involved in cell wall biosynthesis